MSSCWPWWARRASIAATSSSAAAGHCHRHLHLPVFSSLLSSHTLNPKPLIRLPSKTSLLPLPILSKTYNHHSVVGFNPTTVTSKLQRPAVFSRLHSCICLSALPWKSNPLTSSSLSPLALPSSVNSDSALGLNSIPVPASSQRPVVFSRLRSCIRLSALPWNSNPLTSSSLLPLLLSSNSGSALGFNPITVRAPSQKPVVISRLRSCICLSALPWTSNPLTSSSLLPLPFLSSVNSDSALGLNPITVTASFQRPVVFSRLRPCIHLQASPTHLNCLPSTTAEFKKSWRPFCRDSEDSEAEASESESESESMGEQFENASMRSFQVVVAATREHGIGKNGALPWTLPSDMKFFKQVTSETVSTGKKNALVMGHNTWLSIPRKFRPLPRRLNVILSRTKTSEDFPADEGDVVVSGSLSDALELLASPTYAAAVETVYVIGGGQVFDEAMKSPLCDAIHFTEIESDFNCDTFCPAVDMNFFAVWGSTSPAQENGIRHSFVTYVRRKGAKKGDASLQNGGSNGAAGHDPLNNSVVKMDRNERSSGPGAFLATCILHRHEEYQYLDLIRDIIETGNVKGDRTGTGTISKFGCQMRFNLRNSFPLLTTKRVHWRSIVEELLWFISGSTNAKDLQKKGVHIWDGNSSKEYLDSLGLSEREEGDLGPVYGFQWRHFGAKYSNMHADYSGQGFDQLADVIHKIRTDPNDRRIMLSAWNPADLHLMALPPCHMFAQFYVANGELSCQMYQRSCDMGLGVPFNIASYSLLTCMIAYVCDLLPGDFVHVLGDAHVYKNHVEPLQLQLLNTPRPFPVLKIKSSAAREIDSLTVNDFELIGYEASKKIAMQMAV